MDNFVMGEGEQEVLAEGVEHSEAQLVVMEAPVYRLPAHVEQSIVHPSHIPLQAEAQPTGICGPRD